MCYAQVRQQLPDSVRFWNTNINRKTTRYVTILVNVRRARLVLGRVYHLGM